MMKQTMKAFSMLVLLSMMSLAVSAADYVPRLWAGVVKADSWTTATHKEGIYQLEVKEGGSLTQLSTGGDVYILFSAPSLQVFLSCVSHHLPF